ncbi:FAD/NAD(P)-binding domain-containing protein [Lactarius akahatsu]|uniref:FAD/NAD(P)-binding domain-containing protein n=1 Tax=Lactarius akahatsu TaxID=416441 RepID=A0AAD4LIM0_9AGAM|nr:FAD/NAD(P)-binding domain-containing protein [Lactarius akahatsu]
MLSDRPSCHVVILGGGITGLSAAFHLACKQPNVSITLVEKNARFGGWIRSERVEVRDDDGNLGNVLLEAGPRTIRPNSKSILELIYLLDLRSEVLFTPRASPAGRNRFLHVPPAPGLQALPSSLLSALTLPLGRLVLKSALSEPFIPANKPHPPQNDDDDDALVHGIYAADSRRLSVRAAFPTLRASERRGNGSVMWGELGPPAWFGRAAGATDGEDGEWETDGDREWDARIAAAAVLSFRGGMETLVRALVKALRGFPNVTLRGDTAVRGIRERDDEAHSVFEVHLVGADEPLKATHIISALPLPVLHSVLATSENTSPLPHLLANPHSTVTVLNLVFAAPPAPRSLHPPWLRLPRPPPRAGQDDGEFVKMTAMLGGPHASSSSSSDSALLASVLPLISAQLGGSDPLPAPVHYAVHRNVESIPTYLVGHTARMKELRKALRERWGGRLEVVGAGVGGVSVADCVKAGRHAAHQVATHIEAA